MVTHLHIDIRDFEEFATATVVGMVAIYFSAGNIFRYEFNIYLIE